MTNFSKSTALSFSGILFVLAAALLPARPQAAPASVEDVKSIARLYSAAFDRDPATNGLNFWVDSFEAGKSLTQIARGFYESPEFTAKYGALDDEAYVRQLYRNVLGREGEQSGIEFWTGRLAAGAARANIMAGFAEAPENIEKTEDTFASMRLQGGQWVFGATAISCPVAGLTPSPGELPDDPPNIPVSFYSNLAYGSDPDMIMDLWVPESDDPVAVIVYIHGGGFKRGDKRQGYAEANYIVERQTAFATINYPLLDGVKTVIDSLEAGARAVQFLRCHAGELGLDPARVAVGGDSAGGGMALWLATHDDLAQLDSNDLVLTHSSRISASASFSTQSTYDIARWSEVLHTGLQAYYDAGLLPGFDVSQWLAVDGLNLFYDVDGFDDLYVAPMPAYRQNVDMLGLMDAADAPLCANNQGAQLTLENFTEFDSFHEPLHAMAIKTRADEVGLESVVYAQGHFVQYVDPSGEDCWDFALRHVQ